MNSTALPTIKGYGEYKSGNYGAHSLRVQFPSGLTIWYSYETVVAFQQSYNAERIVRQNDWSTTTGKHLNWIDGGSKEAKKARMKGETFELVLADMLKIMKLA